MGSNEAFPNSAGEEVGNTGWDFYDTYSRSGEALTNEEL